MDFIIQSIIQVIITLSKIYIYICKKFKKLVRSFILVRKVKNIVINKKNHILCF